MCNSGRRQYQRDGKRKGHASWHVDRFSKVADHCPKKKMTKSKRADLGRSIDYKKANRWASNFELKNCLVGIGCNNNSSW